MLFLVAGIYYKAIQRWSSS